MIETSQDLKILFMAGIVEDLTDEAIAFPLWVPTFDHRGGARHVAGRDLFKTSNGLPSFLLPSLDENALILRGLRFDSLVSDGRQFLGEDVPEMFDGIWNNVANQAVAYTEGRDRLWAFYMTIAAGKTIDFESTENNASHRADIWAYEKQLFEAAEASGRKPSNRIEMWGEEIQVVNYDGNPTKFQASMVNAFDGSRIFMIEKGYIGMGPSSMCIGDVVCILFGGEVPYLLRPKGSHWQFIGDCYVHGIMQGEGLKGFNGDVSQAEVFEIR